MFVSVFNYIFIFTIYLTCYLSICSRILSDILLGIHPYILYNMLCEFYSNILSGILSDILSSTVSGIYVDTLAEICSDILSCIACLPGRRMPTMLLRVIASTFPEYPVFVISFLEIQKIFTATLADSHIFSHLWHLSTYLSIYIDPSIHPSIYLSICLSVYLSICRSYSARLPWNLEVESWKTKLFCETSFKFGSWQHQNRSNSARLPRFLKLATSRNKAILRDFRQKWKTECRADGLVPMRFVTVPLHLSKVLRWPRKSKARSYEVLHLSRKITLGNLKIWCSKMQPL